MRYNSIIMKKYVQIATVYSLTLAPLLASAATNQTLKDVIGTIAGYLDLALKLIMGLAVLFFVWNVVKYFIINSDSAKRAEAAQYVMWSLIGFFVILSLWGLVNILMSTFSLNNNTPGSLTSLPNLFPQ